MMRFTAGFFVAAVAAIALAQAPANPPVRIRGTIEKLEGQNLTVKDRVKLALKGDREARGILVRDANKVVATAVIHNPRH